METLAASRPGAVMKLEDKLSKRTQRISVSATLNVLSEAEKLKARGIEIFDFGPGEPDFPTPENVKEAGLRSIRTNFTKYTATSGIMPLREAMARRHARDFGSQYTAQETIVSVGGKQALFNAIASLVDHGDEVILPTPFWVTFQDLVTFFGGTPVFVPATEENDFCLKAADIERAITPKTKLIIINSPNNPSGGVVDDQEFRKIARVVIDRDLFLLSDEAYSHFLYEGRKPFSIASVGEELKSRLVIIGTLSKTYAMTGWRLGYGLAPTVLIQQMLKIQSHSTSNAASISQQAALEALNGPQDSVTRMLGEYTRRREYVLNFLKTIPGLHCARPLGAFYVYPNISAFYGRKGIQNSMDFAKALLDQARIAVVPGEAFGTREHIRISYATSMETLERGLAVFKKFIADLG
ncbi:MAG: pyridoxal phosphate-dependent aminotransferase [Acidobacteriia bacterium]|nr:pyridoxal phosphate-dependent aminotransferase [Terriglobia bacterium]